MTTALFIGRFAPAHQGHINVIMQLLDKYDRLVIGLGSCYQSGLKRHPLLAIYREKILLLSIMEAGGDISRVKVVYIQDYNNFDLWFDDVLLACKENNVTHLVTGNREDILDILDEKKLDLPFEIVRPVVNPATNYHATDLRRAVAEGDFNRLKEIASFGTLILMGSIDGFNGIRTAFEDAGHGFYAGRQTADVIFTIQEKVISPSKKAYYKTYVLCGRRPATKIDYPLYLGVVGDKIEKFESPIQTVLRALKEKTGIDVTLELNTCEPALVSIKTGDKPILAELGFVDLYTDKELAGQQGGSSQAFQINIIGKKSTFDKLITNPVFKFMPVNEVLEQGLAYEQSDMLRDAINRLKDCGD